MSPYEKFTGMKPDLSHMRVFGCKVYAKNPGKRRFKLDNNTSQGYFLGYTAISKNINYIDLHSGNVKLATHVIFDEAHMTTPAKYTPVAAQTLQRLGYYSKEIYQQNEIDGIWTVDTNVEEHPNCTFFKTRESADMPIELSEHRWGFRATESLIVPPNSTITFDTNIGIKCYNNTYTYISKPPSPIEHITIQPTTYDRTSNEFIYVNLHNPTSNPVTILKIKLSQNLNYETTFTRRLKK